MKTIKIILVLVLMVLNVSAQFMGGNGSGYAQGSLNIPLSFSDIQLEIREGINGNKLNWEVIVDQSKLIKKIELQRSANQFDWRVLFSSTKEQDRVFYYLDKKPFVGENYYRLKITREDLTEQYSSTVFAMNTIKGKVKLYPVPATDQLILEHDQTIRSIKLIDVAGKVIRSMTYQGQNKVQFSIDDLQSGLYYIRVDNGLILTFSKL